ncbi:MAG: nucleotide sugar dehydrogenase [Bacteriovoracia bacterium]
MSEQIGIIGVGYVGLPLAIAFSKNQKVIAFDLNAKRIQELNNGFDRTNEADSSSLKNGNLVYTSNKDDLANVDIYIVTVPTPVDEFNVPDLNPLLTACDIIGSTLKKGNTVVFESTVYPGLTEEILAPKLEEVSSLKYNTDFFLGYSPERINPGDKEHTIEKITKVVSGSTPETLDKIASLYSRIIKAGVHKTTNIATAEAAKVIENIQRDVNVGLINELATIFEHLKLDIYDVLEASGTKWNFLKFKPGLVGGHCIGVDPYYLTHKAQQLGLNPAMILAGRRINDSMPSFFATKLVKNLIARKLNPVDAEVLVLGFTFKENCPDVRNTKVAELVNQLSAFGIKSDIVDPIADVELARLEYNVDILKTLPQNRNKKYAAAILAVSHKELLDLVQKGTIETELEELGFIFDIKGSLKASHKVLH